MDPITAAVISWAASRLGDEVLKRLGRLGGDPYLRTLRKLVRAAVKDAVELAVPLADRQAVWDSLMRESPQANAVLGTDVASMSSAILGLLRPRLTALTAQGYRIDAELLAQELIQRIAQGIDADAARGGHLTPLSKLVQHKEELEALRAIHRTLELRLPEPDAIHAETKIGSLAQTVAIGTSIATDYSGPIRNFLTEYLGRADSPVPFGGRGAELNSFDRWLATTNGPPYLVVAGPAGRGKSALVVQWLRQIEEDPRVRVAFVPVSQRFGTASASVFFPALAARLASIYRRPVPATAGSLSSDWQGIAADLLTTPAPDGTQILVVLDGLDEAIDWRPAPDLFPLDPPTGLRVMVTARYLVGDPNAAVWAERLGWSPNDLATAHDLSSLDQSGIAELLQASGLPAIAGELDLADQLFKLTAGDPLLTGLYVTNLVRRDANGALLEPADLPHLPPGLAGYFDRWLDQLHRRWGDQSPLREPAVKSMLSLLAVARGPISRDDVLHLVPELDSWTLDDTMRSFERLVIGDGKGRGYVFGHPRLADYFAARMTGRERQQVLDHVLDWGAAALRDFDAGQPTQRLPDYLSLHLADHLADAGRHDDLLALGRNRRWADGQLEKDPSGATLLHDLQASFAAATSLDHANAARGECLPAVASELGCMATESTIRSLSQAMPTPIIIALVDAGELTGRQALQLAELNPDIVPRMRSIMAICARCLAAEELSSITRRALEAIRIGPRDKQLQAFEAIAAQVPPEVVPAALAFVEEALQREQQAAALAAIAHRFDSQTLERALSILRGSYDGLELASAFATLLPAIAGVHRETLLRTVLSIIRGQAGVALGPQTGRVLLKIADEVPPGERAALAAEAIAHGQADLGLIADAAHYLPPAQRDQALSTVVAGLTATSADASRRSIWDPAPSLLAAIGPHLPANLCPAALGAVAGISDEDARARAIEAIIPWLPADLMQQALATAESFGTNSRLRPQIEVVKRLVDLGELGQAREVADRIEYWRTRDWGLGVVATGLARAGSEADALAMIESLSDYRVQLKALGWVLDYLPGDLRPKAIGCALALVNRADVQVMLADDYSTSTVLELAKQIASSGDYEAALEVARALPLSTIHSTHPRAQVLASLLQSAPAEVVTRAVAEAKIAARAIADYPEQAQALRAVAGILPEDCRAEPMTCVLAAALAISDTHTRAQVLIDSLDDLGAADRMTALAAIAVCLQALARQPGDNGMGLGLLRAVASRLSESQIEMLLPLNSERPQPHTVEESAEADLIAVLGPYVPARLTTQVRRRAEGIAIGRARIQALAGLLPAMRADERHDLITMLFAQIETMAVGPADLGAERLQAIAALILQLDAAELARANELIAVTERAAGATGKYFEDDYWAGKFWEALADVLLAVSSTLIKAGRPDETVADTARIKDGDQRYRVLAALVPHLPDPLLSQVGELWSRSQGDFGYFTDLTIALGLREPPDSESESWLVSAIAHAAQPRWKAHLAELTELVPKLKPAGRTALANFFLTQALPGHRAVGLAHIAVHATAAEKDQFFELALSSLEGLQAGEQRGTVLEVISQTLPDGLLARATKIAMNTVHPGSGGSLYSRRVRARALAALAPRLAQLPRQQLQPIWEDLLPELAALQRADFLIELASLTPVVAALADDEYLVDVFTEVRDVLAHWP